jgi:hypothetical protein
MKLVYDHAMSMRRYMDWTGLQDAFKDDSLPEGLQLQPEVISSFRRKLWYNIRQGILSFNTIFFFLNMHSPGGRRMSDDII